MIALLSRYAPTWLAQMPGLTGDAELETVHLIGRAAGHVLIAGDGLERIPIPIEFGEKSSLESRCNGDVRSGAMLFAVAAFHDFQNFAPLPGDAPPPI